jgi:hypothetical protein
MPSLARCDGTHLQIPAMQEDGGKKMTIQGRLQTKTHETLFEKLTKIRNNSRCVSQMVECLLIS